MLGLLFIYFIGKYFYKLAEEYKQNKWLFAILSIVVYYAGTAIVGAIIGILSLIFGFHVDWNDELLMVLIALPSGFGSCWLFYYLLKRNWQGKVQIETESIDSIGKEDDNASDS